MQSDVNKTRILEHQKTKKLIKVSGFTGLQLH